MSKAGRLVYIAFIASIVSGCALPNPTVSPITGPSPINLPNQSPLPTAALTMGPLFTISLPVRAKDTVVRGTGGPGVPLRVVNLTQMATELGQGTVGPDGKFEIKIPQGLPKDERIGLMLGDLSGTRFQATDFLGGPGYVDTPYIGTVFTSTLVLP